MIKTSFSLFVDFKIINICLYFAAYYFIKNFIIKLIVVKNFNYH